MNYHEIVSSFDPGFMDQFRWIGLGDLLGSKDNLGHHHPNILPFTETVPVL